MKKSLMCIALALFASGAQAEPEAVYFTLKSVDSTSISSVSTLVGQPALIQRSSQQMKASCSFPHSFGGDPATIIQAKIEEGVSSGITFSVLPVETSETGLKAYVTINQEVAQEHEWAEINKECKLPVGKSSTASIRTFETFKWEEPKKLKFTDGSEMILTVSKEYKTAGIDYPKLSAEFHRDYQKAQDLIKKLSDQGLAESVAAKE